jgi:hypothetical protein
MTTSPLFKNLGMASGLSGMGAGGPEDSTNPFTQQSPYALKPAQTNPAAAAPQIAKWQIRDTRKLNPATGLPFRNGAPMSADINPDVAKAVIRQAMSKGVDPNTALAIAMQETKMGNLNENVGSAWATLPDEGINDPYEQGANSLAKTLADKLQYAKRLGYDKKGEEYALQAYNGYGKVFPKNTDRNAKESYYGIPVTHQNPLNMANNPIYGKNIISVRDEIIKKHPQLQELIKAETVSRKKPMQSPATAYSGQ